ncbi:MBL fold metallo-hydrolase [Pseudomonas sp. 5P_5.1_Bac1]|uniref:MBL fold metallo-hydrolase n=1 Tax=Pseudomonas sp. 5P_5.1_Bac1 TaxID=2971616 RepID=UPI003965D4ED
MVFPIITHHGATRGVTGSCHQLHLDAQCSVLIDCGLFQGVEASTQPYPVIDFPVERLKALVVTHVHLDHVGRIPTCWLRAIVDRFSASSSLRSCSLSCWRV